MNFIDGLFSKFYDRFHNKFFSRGYLFLFILSFSFLLFLGAYLPTKFVYTYGLSVPYRLYYRQVLDGDANLLKELKLGDFVMVEHKVESSLEKVLFHNFLENSNGFVVKKNNGELILNLTKQVTCMPNNYLVIEKDDFYCCRGDDFLKDRRVCVYLGKALLQYENDNVKLFNPCERDNKKDKNERGNGKEGKGRFCKYLIPDGYYFISTDYMYGYDSRYFGFVYKDEIKAKLIPFFKMFDFSYYKRYLK